MPLFVPSPIIQPAYAAGDFIYPAGLGSVTDRTPSTSAHVSAWFFGSQLALRLDRVGVHLTTPQTGAACMLGLYSNNRGRPSALLLDAGEVSLASGSGLIAATISYSIIGPFWVLAWMKNVATQATIKGTSTQAGGGFFPQPGFGTSSAAIISLGLDAAYPASMPATAPAVVTTGTSTSDPIPILRSA